MFEIDEAANRIKEEVDEEANIIFGSSFDENLAGKIRVSIVATGIEGGRTEMPKAKPQPKPANYIEESFSDEPIIPITPSEEMDSNLAKFAATLPADPEENEETPARLQETDEEPAVELTEEEIAVEEKTEPAAVVEEEPEMFADPQSRAPSSMGDMPQASSLFNAILNKNEFNDVDAQLESLISSQGSTFSAKNAPRMVEEEPELFGHNPQLFASPKEEPVEKLIVNDEEEEYTPTLIERVTGFSIAKRNRKKKMEAEHYQEPVTPSFSDSEEDRVNLDIPSFLRRR